MQPNISCRAVADWLPWYVNGTLSATKCDDLHAHVAQCLACRESLQIEHRLADAILSRPVQDSDSGHRGWQILSANLDVAPRAPNRSLASWPKRWQAAALTAVALAAFGLLALHLPRPPETQAQRGEFRTLAADTLPAAVDSATALDVVVASQITAGEVQRLAVAIGADVAGGPDPFNRYRLILPADNRAASAASADLLPNAAATWLRRQHGVLDVQLTNAGSTR